MSVTTRRVYECDFCGNTDTTVNTQEFPPGWTKILEVDKEALSLRREIDVCYRQECRKLAEDKADTNIEEFLKQG